MKNKVKCLILGIVILLVFIIGFYFLIFSNNIDFSETPYYNQGYYENLLEECNGDSCCISSVEYIEDGNFSLALEGYCPEGYVGNMLKCEGSYKWCEPVE